MENPWRGPLTTLAVLVCLLLAACTNQPLSEPEPFRFERATANGPLTLRGDLWLPRGNGRVPVMILSHGSSGYIPAKRIRYVAALNDMGVAVLGIDHFGPRGIGNTVYDQSQLSEADMARDEFAALDALARHPRIDADRAGVAGFSKGGGAVWYAALSRFNTPRGPTAHRFALYVAFYPFCGEFFRDLRTTGGPVRFLVGGDDDYVGSAQCVELAQRMRAAGGDAETVVYPGARHAFDQDIFNGYLFVDSWQNCVMEELGDGLWRERGHGLVFRWNDPVTSGAAIRACTHPGVTIRMNWPARDASMERLKQEVALHLLGKTPPDR